MEERDRSRSPSRRTSRVEQVVGRWLRRSRESTSSITRERVLDNAQGSENGTTGQRSCAIRVTLKIPLDLSLKSHGFTISSDTPPQVQEVTDGGPADGKLVSGDQLFKINNVAVDDLSSEQAADIIRYAVFEETGPKSSFITPEKRAKLKSNPFKVRFAEEVVVNGHSQGNSLLFLPNVLKVYLENGQTKAFKFESKTTVKVVAKKETHDYRCLFRVCFLPRDLKSMLYEDPVALEYLYLQSVSDVLQERFAVEMKCNAALRLAALHVQEKLASSGQSLKTPLKAVMKEWGIESFVSHTLLRNMREKDLKKAISYHLKKLLSLEPKQKVISVDQARLNYLNEMSDLKSFGGKAFSATMMVVAKKETHDYRCLFRVCFLPRDLKSMLYEDPVALEYLYLQSVSDVLQERFAVEMKCNAALRLAALHVQEKLASSGQSLKTPLKAVMKEWGIESFVSHTLLRNMREKDLKKAISYHLKKLLSLEPKQKLQDRESVVSLLVGAQYGVSQVINHKLSIMTTLTEFSCITRVELLPESDRVSLVKIYLQDVKPITLLMESVAAKDLLCLIAGYCKLLVDPQICVFPWTPYLKSHRISAEEDTDVDALLAHVASVKNKTPDDKLTDEPTKAENYQDKNEEVVKEEGKDGEMVEKKEILDNKENFEQFKHVEGEVLVEVDHETFAQNGNEEEAQEKPPKQCFIIVDDPSSEASDSYQTEPHVMNSMSSDSIDALEEDDLTTYFSTRHPWHLSVKDCVACQSPSPEHMHCQSDLCSADSHCGSDIDKLFCFAALSNIAECLPSPPAASEEEDYEESGVESKIRNKGSSVTDPRSTLSPPGDYVFTFEPGDTRHYYNICSNVTPDSAHCLPKHPIETLQDQEETVRNENILQPPPGFGDSSSDEEFFDAQERFTSPEEPSSSDITRENSAHPSTILNTLSPGEFDVCASKQVATDSSNKQRDEEKIVKPDGFVNFDKSLKKRRSFMETSYTSLVSFPEQNQLGNRLEDSLQRQATPSSKYGESRKVCFDGDCTDQVPCLTVSYLTDSGGEPAQLEYKPITMSKINGSVPNDNTGLQVGLYSTKAYQCKQQRVEMEPDSMEFKSVTELMSTMSPSIVALRSRIDLHDKGFFSNTENEEEGAVGGLLERVLGSQMFLDMSRGISDSSISLGQSDDKVTGHLEDLFPSRCVSQKSSSLPRLRQIPPSCLPQIQVPNIPCTTCEDDNNIHRKLVKEKLPREPTERTRSQSVSVPFGFGTPLCPSRDIFSNQVGKPDDQLSDPSSFEPAQNFLLPPGILGRLSTSTLRGKIQNLPLYLSRSQELLNSSSYCSDHVLPLRRYSETQLPKPEVELGKEIRDPSMNKGSPEVTELKVLTIVSEEVTEVIEEVREVAHTNQQESFLKKPQTKPKLCQKSTPFSYSSANNSLQISPSSVVVTTQNINGPWGVVMSSGFHEYSHSPSSTKPQNFTSNCGVFTNCLSKPTIAQPQTLSNPTQQEKPDFNCSSVLSMGCDTIMEGAQTPLEVCQSVYTNCFSGVLDSNNFDDEITVYEFSRKMSQGETEDTLERYFPPSSLSASPVTFSPSSPMHSFLHPVVLASSSAELSPLLYPLDATACFLSDSQEDVISSLLTRRYPLPPTGFLSMQMDVNTLLSVLAGAAKNQDGIQEHSRDSCVAHFSENKRRLHGEARGFLAGCQCVVRVGQTPEEMLRALSESFRSLVQLTSVCLCFSSCQRCRERHIQALAGLTNVAKTYQDFARAAELVGSDSDRMTRHNLSIKLLARQCTALTTSVFCLTQLFRTLTAL
ncbi:hypothetical protein DNTS_005924 [Danionella cerebrum]|uniref:FERM and PDZ domain-containing protein 1 n=1 Tax=Danionella cerebrum TaxID=2873325 RepID=A0A553NIV4_9TELE|nr:hypothetical protein DNTS_005924 [Danionella translucida]TRY65347.1 hypothetical protein DNTS_005924 [Danionella translucida]